jgi:hypothetical protein
VVCSGDARKRALNKAAALRLPRGITDKVTEVVVLGPRRYDPPPPRFTTPDTFVAGRQDFCESVAQLKRGLIRS